MSTRLKNTLAIIIFLAFAVSLAFYDKEYILKPACSEPIPYSIGTLDPRFHISKSDLLATLSTATGIWSKAINKPLFVYAPTSTKKTLQINLIYDYRQQATEELNQLGISIDTSKIGYDQLKEKYLGLIATYNQQKADLQSEANNFQAKQNAYEAEVQSANNNGGATPDQYTRLQTERQNLQDEQTTLQQHQDALNSLVDSINSLKDVLNEMVDTLNLNVQKFNDVGSSVGKTFKEGEYVRDGLGNQSINVYQFDDQSKLLKVMTHELGHALGLEHVQNPNAIMYYLNEGSNTKVTTDDLNELKKVCGLQ